MSCNNGPERSGFAERILDAIRGGGDQFLNSVEGISDALVSSRRLLDRGVKSLSVSTASGVASGMIMMSAVFMPVAATTPLSMALPSPATHAIIAGTAADAAVVPAIDQPAEATAPATETAAPAAPRAESSYRGSRPTPDISTPQKFIEAVAPVAQESQREHQVPASVTIAQAILESEWGRSGLSKQGQNYFGIKALSGPGPAGVISMKTWEVYGGQDVVVTDGFKAYHNLDESVMDHGRFLRDNSRYAEAFKTSNPHEFARRIHKAGYATDPAYTDKVNSLIAKYDLTQYDVKQ